MTDYTVGDTIYHKFTTRAFATGVPTTLAGTPVVSIYEDDSVTQITAGITLTVDFDSVTGLNHLTVVATGANGYEIDKFYQAVITTGTVSSVSVVGEVVWTFSLGAGAAAQDLANATDGLGALKTDTAATQALAAGATGFAAIDTVVDAVKVKTDFLPSVTAGGAGGVFISGSNAATTMASTTITGEFTISDGVDVSCSTLNKDAFVTTGNGTGHGISAVSGSGATGSGISAVGASTDGNGIQCLASGSASGIRATGGTFGSGVGVLGGATSGDGISVTTTSGHGINLAPSGTSKHGIFATGGNGGTSDGMNLIAGTGGIALRAAEIQDIDTVVDAILVDTGTTLPDQIGGIGTAGGSAISKDTAGDNYLGGISGVTSGTTKVDTETNTFANTSFDDGAYHVMTHDTNAIDIVYQYLTGGGTSPVSVTWNGYIDGANDTITVSAWKHTTGAWEAIGSIVGQGGTVDIIKTFALYPRHMGTSAAELGKIYIRLHCTGMSSPILYTDQLFVDYAVTSRSVGYAMGNVWIDTVTGVAGTESFVNGVADNPVLTLADALTIATANKLRKFWVGNGSTITLASTLQNKVFEGHEWTLALGGQDIAGTMFIDADMTGTATGVDAEFEDCIVGTSSVEASQWYNCSFTGTQTLSATGDYRYIACQSGIAGASAPTFALGTGDITMEFRRWSGGMNLTGIGLNDVITISGELGTVDLGSATAGTVEIRGTYKALTNASSGVTVNVAGAILGGDVAAVKAKTDSLTFTTANEVDSNVQSVNDVIVTGVGSAGDPWGP